MKIEKFTVQACCGRTSLIYKIDKPIDKILLASFVSKGYIESAHFTKAGILYADNLDFIVTGPFGADKLQVKCKQANCDQKLNDFEDLLRQLG